MQIQLPAASSMIYVIPKSLSLKVPQEFFLLWLVTPSGLVWNIQLNFLSQLKLHMSPTDVTHIRRNEAVNGFYLEKDHGGHIVLQQKASALTFG